MYGQTARRALATAPALRTPRTALSRRCLNTAPPHKSSRSWKNSLARWGIAGGLVYYYNAGTAFADEPRYAIHSPPATSHESEQETYQTIDELAAQRQAARKAAAAAAAPPPSSAEGTDGAPAVAGSPEELEEEAEQQGAFNEETGEINWDCPCLGGMAHGPCGEQFRAAFSCFVFSKEEPKGVDCIDKFKGMQDCFREHPDIYGSELEEDETAELIGEEGEGAVPAGAEHGVGEAQAASVAPSKSAKSGPASSQGGGAAVASPKESSE